MSTRIQRQALPTVWCSVVCDDIRMRVAKFMYV